MTYGSLNLVVVFAGFVKGGRSKIWKLKSPRQQVSKMSYWTESSCFFFFFKGYGMVWKIKFSGYFRVFGEGGWMEKVSKLKFICFFVCVFECGKGGGGRERY